MPLKLKSFSQPDQLKRFQPEILLRLFEPFRLFFEMRGFALPSPDGGEIDLPALAGSRAKGNRVAKGHYPHARSSGPKRRTS